MSSWFDGIKIDEVAFCEAFTEECPLIFVDGVFYTKYGTISEQQLEKQITNNGVPKSLYDKTAGWERRLIILSAKPVPRGRVNDPNLSDRLAEETEGIFLWAFEGLKRLIAQGFKFTLSDHARRNIEEMKEDNCSIVGFLADAQFVRYGSGLECSTADLYYGYCQWCRINSVTYIRRESFNTWMKQNADRYGLVYERYVASVGSSKKARGYRGITCLYRVCAD